MGVYTRSVPYGGGPFVLQESGETAGSRFFRFLAYRPVRQPLWEAKTCFRHRIQGGRKMEYTTQMDAARKGIVTEELRKGGREGAF